MLRYTDDLVDAMIEIVVAKRWLQTMVNVIEFQQMLIQGIWVKVRTLESSRELSWWGTESVPAVGACFGVVASLPVLSKRRFRGDVYLWFVTYRIMLCSSSLTSLIRRWGMYSKARAPSRLSVNISRYVPAQWRHSLVVVIGTWIEHGIN